MNWWNRFLIWLGISEPGTRKEQVEDWIEAHEADITGLRTRLANQRGSFSSLAGDLWYTHIGSAERVFGTNIPIWVDVEVNVYEAPVTHRPKSTRMGYSIAFLVTELDNSRWRLEVEPGVDTFSWQDVTPIAFP